MHTRQMSISLADFLRLLPQVTGQTLSSTRAKNAFIDAEKGIGLEWKTLPPADFGALKLPQLEVQMTFSGNAEQAEAFLRQFDRIYQRGGG